MHLREFCDIQVSGRGLYKFVNALRKSPVSCGEQRCAGEVFRGRILRSDLTQVRALAEALHLECEVRPLPSVMRRIRHFRLRFGLMIGFFLAALLIFLQSNTVATIEIQGAVTVDAQAILAILSQEGVERGTWIGDIDMLHCERRICAAFPEVAWSGIRHTGNRLVVEIAEARQQTEMLHERTPSNIISRYDAQITTVEVNAGQLCRLPGDGVVKGALLVAGEYADQNGTTHRVHSLGSISGIYTREAELTAYLDQTQSLPTGRTWSRKWFRFFEWNIPLTAGKPDFTESRSHVSETQLQFLHFSLPCSILYETTEEISTQTRLLTPEAAKQAANADIMRYEKNFLRDVKILSRQVEYREYSDCVTAHVRFTVEGEIGQQQELYFIP